MPFNGLSNADFSQAPWQSGVMTLTHDECVYVKEKCAEVAASYEPENSWESPNPDKTYIISQYNQIDNWEKAINGDTYDVLQGYDVETQTEGIKPAEEGE